MKKNLIILSLIACLFSCGNVTGNGGTEIDDSDKGQFYSSELVDFSKDGLSKFYVSDGYGNGTPFGNTWSKTCVEIENNELKLSIKEPGDIPYQLDPVISGAVHYRGDGEDYTKSYGYYSCFLNCIFHRNTPTFNNIIEIIVDNYNNLLKLDTKIVSNFVLYYLVFIP